MVFPAITALYAAILALVYAALSAWVIAGRVTYRVNHGDGGNERLNRRIRAHGNFAEYVPFILLLMGLFEASGGSRIAIHAALLILTLARLLHPIGMVAPEASLQQYLCRGASASATWLVLVAAALLLLIRIA